MKKLLLVISVVLVGSAQAQDFLPDGCYVTYSNPSYCYAPPSGYLLWQQSLDQVSLVYKYGTTMAAIVSYGYKREVERNTCSDTLVTRENDVSACNADYNVLVDSYNVCASQHQQLNTRLRKAKRLCGSKCKRI